jgi:ribosomal peptide maturation radical SAM protein 1
LADNGSEGRIDLLSAPWALFSRPSIQLGALRAYLTSRTPLRWVTAHHHYLEVARTVGYDRYRAVSERSWLAETVYGALLRPDRYDPIARLYRREAAGRNAPAGVDFNALVRTVEAATEAFVDGIDWKPCRLLGVSVSLCQLTASLYTIERIKRRAPDLFVVVGGSTLAGSATPALFAAFPDIDAVVVGEGERALARLADHRLSSDPDGPLPAIDGVVTPENAQKNPHPAADQLPDLDRLPVPDYREYFQLLAGFSPGDRFFPTLPVEASRGCPWRRHRGGDRPGGCAFCNLNLQWSGYRIKSARRAAGEVRALAARHQLVSVAFTDNALPPSEVRALFAGLAEGGRSLDVFGEVRPNLSPAHLAAMANGGLNEVQIGIEALSTALLRRLNKGTTAIDNLAILKTCEALGIKSNSNLIIHFPGSGEADVAETLRALAAARPFRPLRVVRFWLGLESPVCRQPKAYGIRAVFNHPHYDLLFGKRIGRTVRFPTQAYRGDRMRQEALWKPVVAAVRKWEEDYAALHAGPRCRPILGHRDGGDFLILRQRGLEAEPNTHRLVGRSREIYLYCDRPRSVARIRDRFPAVAEDQLLPFLKMMADKGLMFGEGDRWLSLSVDLGGRR